MSAGKRIYTRWLFVILLFAAVLSVTVPFYMIFMPGLSVHRGFPDPDDTERVAAVRLRTHVEYLADDIGERHYQLPAALQRAADYIHDEFVHMGYAPFEQVYDGKDQRFRNVVAVSRGTQFPDQVIVLGAHYDSVWLSPGADDNASGVAVLLEVARRLQQQALKQTLHFVAFTNEESPFFNTGLMGSRVYLQRIRQEGLQVRGMISLEMLGYYDATPGSQHYPFPLSLIYPDQADFLAFVGNFDSRKFVHRAIDAFREARRLPAAGLAIPAVLVPDIRRSDQYSFWQAGIPAFMITDTANFRNPYYHTGGDLPGTLDYESMSRATTAISRMLQVLAGP